MPGWIVLQSYIAIRMDYRGMYMPWIYEARIQACTYRHEYDGETKVRTPKYVHALDTREFLR